MYHFLVWHLLHPYTILLLLTGLGLANLWRKRSESRKRLLLVTVPYVLLVVFSLPAVAYLLVGSLEWQYPGLERRPEDTQAIVVLSSGVRRPDGPRRGFELDEDSLNRCLRAAEVYREGKPCPVVATGGPAPDGDPDHSVAAAMGDFLVQLGVRRQDLILEEHASSTHENAVNTAKLLQKRGLRRIVLVTTATHLPRAVRCFQKQGLEPTACGAGFKATPGSTARFGFVPQMGAAQGSQRVAHEWLGLAWYWLRDRI